MFSFCDHERNDNQRRMPNISMIYDDRCLPGNSTFINIKNAGDKQQELRRSGVNELLASRNSSMFNDGD